MFFFDNNNNIIINENFKRFEIFVVNGKEDIKKIIIKS